MNSLLRIITILLLLTTSLKIGAIDGRTFQVIDASKELADNSAQIVVCTKTGRMIISTLGNINFYTGSSFTHIGTRQEYQYQLPKYKGNYHLYFDRKHHIWLKNTHTVTCVDLLMEEFVTNVDSVVKSMGAQGPIQDLFVDSVGGVWFLMDEGLYGVNNQKTYNVLRDQNLQDVDVFDSLLVTFYDSGEEITQDLNTGRTMHRTKAYDWETSQRYNNSSSILRYEDGYFQVRNGAKESVFMFFDVKKCEWTIIQEFPYHTNNMALHHDRIYIPSEWGFWIYDIGKKEMTWVKEITLSDGNVIQTDCNTMAFDRQDGLWIGTERRGVLYARPTIPVFQSIPWSDPAASKYEAMMEEQEQNITEFQGMRANCMYMDSRGWSWIGTLTGLYLYKTPQSEPIVFSRTNGLYNNVIHSVVEDKNHHIWVATSNGISCIRFKNNEVVFVNSFDTTDGVPSESFANCKAMLLDDGRIVMQSIDHIVLFNPDNLDELNTPHPTMQFPKLVRLMVNGNYIEAGMKVDDNIIIDRALSRVWDINLKSTQTTVSLTFSALNYYRPLQTYYRIRVEGLKGYEDWAVYSIFNSDGKVDSKGMFTFPLLGLKPGTYTVELQTSMYPDVWDNKPYKWNIIVNQPWWQTTGLIWLLAFILLTLAIINLVFYVRNERMRLHRNHEEEDIIHKIRKFVSRCDASTSDLLSPTQDDFRQDLDNTASKMSPQFIKVMMELMPFVREHMQGELTMTQLGAAAKMDVVALYELIMADIYKNPRELARIYRLERAADLLKNSNLTIEQIAKECGFYTPNYMIGNFFHHYKMTPGEYREQFKV